jgi:hypothetical protein
MSQSLHQIQTWNIGGSGPEVRPTDTRDLNDTVQAATTQILLGRDRTRFRPDRRAAVGRGLVRADDLEMFRFQLLGQLVPG